MKNLLNDVSNRVCWGCTILFILLLIHRFALPFPERASGQNLAGENSVTSVNSLRILTVSATPGGQRLPQRPSAYINKLEESFLDHIKKRYRQSLLEDPSK